MGVKVGANLGPQIWIQTVGKKPQFGPTLLVPNLDPILRPKPGRELGAQCDYPGLGPGPARPFGGSYFL